MAILDNIKMMIRVILKRISEPVAVAAIAAIFFILSSVLNCLTQDQNYVKWTSPDETANYFFSKRFAQEHSLAKFDPAAVIGDNMVMPRSFRSDSGWLKPVSFLGIILIYGQIASWAGIWVIPFLTPFFAAIGIFIFYLVVKRLFPYKGVAFWSALALASFPVYFYYSARSMFHNVLFVVLLLSAFYFFSLALGARHNKSQARSFWRRFLSWRTGWPFWSSLICAIFSGAFFGAAIITRSSEIIWIAPAGFIIWLFYARRISLVKIMLFAAGVWLAVLPVVYWNQVLYASAFRGGYNEMNRSLDKLSVAGAELANHSLAGSFRAAQSYALTIFDNLFYFGFNRAQSLAMAKHYIVEMFPVLTVAAIIGALILLGQNLWHWRKKYLVYALVGLTLGAILIFYYGSWRFNDNPDPSRFTIGNSYTRYWLPIYLMMMPLAALALTRFTRSLFLLFREEGGRFRSICAFGLQAALAAVFVFSSYKFVLFGSEEGLAYLYYNNLAERQNAEQVFSLTEADAIIITRYYDKFFFPERRVIMGTLPDAEVLAASRKLVRYFPLYYYNFYLDAPAVSYLNERKFAEYGLAMSLSKKVNAKFGLYRLTATSTPANK